MVLHELATNAVKHGALSVDAGRVQIEWSRDPGGRFVFCWSEIGGPQVGPPTRRGFGMRAIKQLVKGQMHGEIRLDWTGKGLVCTILVPELPIRPQH
jgi:two-component sensor histidine kinase